MLIRFCKDFQVNEFNKNLIDYYDDTLPSVLNKVNKYSNKNKKILRIYKKNASN